ncbi:MAG: protease modulator HflC [Candidatus Omnitrophica bacterium]|nr:protease modulator HflC [Candidatus Omnitrophota bacterium]
MPRPAAIAMFLFVGVILAALLGNPFYTVPEGRQAVITRFGEPVGGAVTKTGLHLRLPFIEQVHLFETRILEWDGDANQIPTKDKRFIWVDTTARWKIADPLKFLQTVGNESAAQARLDDTVDAITRDVISDQLLIEIVRSSNRELTQNLIQEGIADTEMTKADIIKAGRNVLTREILSRAQKMTPEYGIELVDVRIKRIIYIDDVLKKIYERMVAERKRAAQQFRSEGLGRQAEIGGRREKDLNTIRSDAYRRSQEIKGKADAEAARIYAEAYGKDSDFYRFVQTLKSYEKTMDAKTTLVLSSDSDYLIYLKSIDSGSVAVSK